MLLINPENEYPRYIGDLQLEHEDWQEGDALPEGWSEVELTEPPVVNYATETAYEKQPVKRNGKFYQVWDKRNFTDEELALMRRRAITNKVLNGEPLTAEEAATLTQQ